MRMVLPVLGTGTPDDPIRVSFPTYTVVRLTADGRLAVVDVPDDCLPDTFPSVVQATPIDGELIADPRRLSPARKLAWRAHLDARYQEFAGRFQPVQGV